MKNIFTDLQLVNLKTGQCTSGCALVVEDGRFVEITSTPGEGETISLNGGFVLPGLIDAHVHLVWEGQPDPAQYTITESPVMTSYRAARSAWQNLAGGVTTVRDVGGPHNIPIELAKAVKQGIVPGSRILAAGAGIAQTGGHGYFMCREADGFDEIRKAVREQVKAGADLIKLMCSGGAYTQGESIHAMQFSDKEIHIAVQTAKAAGKKVAAHALPDLAVKTCLEAGVDTIEHAALINDKSLHLFKRTGAFMVPTLAPYYLMATQGAEYGVPNYAVIKSQQVMEQYITSLKKVVSTGVNLALGTDAGSPQLPHPALPYEAWLWYKEAGLDPLTILKAATQGSAWALGLEHELGEIKRGYLADFVVYEKNPVEEITALHYPQYVYKEGQLAAGASVIWSVSLLHS
ncbi:aryldialkylphosphatase [Candidatus Vecturithrix granuli]|uniref:Aryldialkylphosphatase n=1 Tax=Vecturithrix granuli TaxID=1499967 RepID=A0A081C3D6_VECG1|nr:aryldialkylphosphatase [Candidatus Vecturithrix granuli]